jgi:hypothetical protein
MKKVCREDGAQETHQGETEAEEGSLALIERHQSRRMMNG